MIAVWHTSWPNFFWGGGCQQQSTQTQNMSLYIVCPTIIYICNSKKLFLKTTNSSKHCSFLFTFNPLFPYSVLYQGEDFFLCCSLFLSFVFCWGHFCSWIWFSCICTIVVLFCLGVGILPLTCFLYADVGFIFLF